jgi:dihydroorotase
MNVLIKSATIIDPTSRHHLKKRDILIEKGVISKISATIKPSKKVREISLKNLHVSPGWFDSSVSYGEPGYEERETISNGLSTAAKSGFTHVAVNSDTFPVCDSKSIVKYLKSKSEDQLVNLYPIGALTKGSKGELMAELYDMHNEGAIAFYDHKSPISNPNMLKIALQYAQGFDGLVQSFPLEWSLAKFGMVNENINSTMLGLKGIPPFAEELQITRDLYILEYTGGKLHIPTISTRKSVQLIREAKRKGMNVSCSVSINNLICTDNELESFDTNFKLLPPLRTGKDINALIKGLEDGTIDGVTSDHCPKDIELKKKEFDHAEYGSIGLESCFGALNSVVSTEHAINALIRLKKVFNIPQYSIAENNQADMSLFDPNKEWTFSIEDILSSSKNAALLGKTLKGKVYGTYSNSKLEITG